jgi:hypothetical protein
MRSYEKSNPEKPFPEQKRRSNNAAFVSSSVAIKYAGKNYRKEEGVLSPKTFFVIVSGGEVRERNYFKIISNQDKFGRIKIDFIADPGQLNPDGLLETAKDRQERYKTSQEERPDKIFIVSDVDHFINDLLRIKPECERLSIELIVSNSCFEVWLYYGRYGEKPADFTIPQNCLEISKSFKTYLDRKVKGGINPKTAIFDIETAMQNAKNIYEEDADGIPQLFSTNMFQLAEQLLPFIKTGLGKIIAENQAKIRFFKKQVFSGLF